MSDSIEQYKVTTRVASELYKHRGDVQAVAEATGFDSAYIRKLAKKLKGKLQHDVAFKTAIMIMESVWVGYYQRTNHLNECLAQLRGKEEAEVSMCCDQPVQVKEEGGKEVTRCGKCKVICFTHVIGKAKIYNMIIRLIEQLREEDIHLINFAEKMGFTVREEQAPNIFKQNILYLGEDARRPKSEVKVELSMTDAETRRVIEEDLTPMERHKLRKKIDAQIEAVKDLSVEGEEESSDG